MTGELDLWTIERRSAEDLLRREAEESRFDRDRDERERFGPPLPAEVLEREEA